MLESAVDTLASKTGLAVGEIDGVTLGVAVGINFTVGATVFPTFTESFLAASLLKTSLAKNASADFTGVSFCGKESDFSSPSFFGATLIPISFLKESELLTLAVLLSDGF
ncbi:hypothetical protein D3C81_1749990 [compost metagenome]